MADKWAELREQAEQCKACEAWRVRELLAERDELLAALEACDVVMDTASMHGVGELLPPAYRDSWVAAHTAAREAIRKAKGEEG